MATKMYPVIAQLWIESEAGWGQRLDSYSLHLTEEDRKAFIKKYWDDEKKNNPSGEVPETYWRQEGSPQFVSVNSAIYKKVKASKNGISIEYRDAMDGQRAGEIIFAGRG